jgi:ketosteroid isomerase-like protein
MSQENVELVRRLYDAVASRDTESVLAVYDPEVEFDLSRERAVAVLGPGVYHGHQGLRNWFREWYDAWESIEDNCEEMIDLGEQVVAVVAHQARGRVSGANVEWTHAALYEIRKPKGGQSDVVREPRGSPRSRRLLGVGDVAGERGTRAVDQCALGAWRL